MSKNLSLRDLAQEALTWIEGGGGRADSLCAELRAARASVAAPAAGDALALEDLQRLIEYAQTSDDCQYGTLSTGLVRDLTAKAIAALAAQVPQQGEA